MLNRLMRRVLAMAVDLATAMIVRRVLDRHQGRKTKPWRFFKR